MCQPRGWASLTQHNKVFSSALGDPNLICQSSSSAFLKGSVRAWDQRVLFIPGTDSAFPVLFGLGSVAGGHGTAEPDGSADAFGYFLAWGKVPGSVMSLVVLPGRAGLLGLCSWA